MPNFVVDPILCTTPDADADPGELVRWFAAIRKWLAVQETSPFDLRHFFSCTNALVETGRFPDFGSMRANARRAGVDVDIAWLLQRLTRFFQEASYDLHAVTATKCAVVSEEAPAIAPPELLTRNLPEVRAPLQDGLLCLACDQREAVPFARDALLVTLPFADGSREVSVAGTVALVEPHTLMPRLAGLVLAERIPVVLSPEDLSAYDYEALLAGGEEGFVKLITAIAESRHPGKQLLTARIGSRFWQSLDKSGIIRDKPATGKLLRICSAPVANILDELIQADQRPLRETQSTNSGQQTRGGDSAKAWRLRIMQHGAGYRLHYWHIPPREDQAAQIEFANVLRKGDAPVIPEA